jgi:predicted extracellular nuclease
MLVALALGAWGCASRDADVERVAAALGQANAPVVISQVYGGGGNASAPWRNDFVELFNRSAAPVAVSGWSVQYASATGTGNFSSNPIAILPSVTLAPGQYLLVQQASGGSTGALLPTPDATGTVNMSATGGKVVLVSSTTGLACNGGTTACSAAQQASIIDLVGWDGASFFEGSAAAPTTSNTTAVLRKGGGCTDTNDNAADFVLGAPQPRNTASAMAACPGDPPPTVASTAPAAGAAGVAATTSVTVTFSEPVTVAGAWYGIACSVSGSVAATASGGPTTYTLAPAAPFAAGETCTVTIHAAGVADSASQPMPADFVFSFTIALPLTAIHDIQGAAHLSPLAGQTVRTTGIATARRSNGYWLQDPMPDADDATSEAIFVFTSSSPTVAVGDQVDVTGTVQEFRPGCSSGCASTDSAFANLTVTELAHPTSRVLSSGNALPPPVVIGAGGRVPPSTVIENDSGPNVETDGNVFDPGQDGLDFYESLEGMRVQMNDVLVVGPTKLFGTSSKEIYIVGDGGAFAGLRTARGGVVISPGDFNPERLVLANDILPFLPDANVGDTFPGATVGVLDYDFGNYRLLDTSLPALQSNGLARETLSLPSRRPADLDVAAFNVENLDPGDPPEKFAQLAAIIVDNLGAPDIISVEEIQDNDGATDDGVVDASVTFGRLVDAITAAGGPSYQFRSIDPVDDQDGGEPGGNIRVGFLFRTDRGLAFVDRPGGGPLTANAVVTTGGSPALQYSPGRVDPTNPAFVSSRKPLAGEFTFNGARLFVIANHFNSKGGDQPLFGRFQPPTLVSETQRITQAHVVADFVGQILAADAQANVVVLGDLNDFEFSAPVGVLKAAGLTTLIETLPPNERYSYDFEGNSQVLDHVLVSAHALSTVAGFDVVHVNAEFATQASDHDPGVARLTLDAIAPVLSGPGNLVAEATGPGGAVVSFTVTATDDLDGSVPVTCLPASGALFPLGITTVSCSASDAEGNVGQLAFQVTVRDTTPPALAGVPGPIAAFATSGAGASVSYAAPSASDVVDGSVAVTCTPVSGSRFAPGVTPVGCSAVDAAGNHATAAFTVTVTFSAPSGGAFFGQPINPDDSSIFKLGRTVPVKFALTGASAGITDLVAHLFLTKVTDGIEGTVVEADSTAAADSGNVFRYDPSSGQYVFNLSTKSLTQGTWTVRADLGDGVLHAVGISLRK